MTIEQDQKADKTSLKAISEASDNNIKSMNTLAKRIKVVYLLATAGVVLLGGYYLWDTFLEISLFVTAGVFFLLCAIVAAFWAISHALILKAVSSSLTYSTLIALELIRIYQKDRMNCETISNIDVRNTRDDIGTPLLEKLLEEISTVESQEYVNLLLRKGGYINYKPQQEGDNNDDARSTEE